MTRRTLLGVIESVKDRLPYKPGEEALAKYERGLSQFQAVASATAMPLAQHFLSPWAMRRLVHSVIKLGKTTPERRFSGLATLHHRAVHGAGSSPSHAPAPVTVVCRFCQHCRLVSIVVLSALSSCRHRHHRHHRHHRRYQRRLPQDIHPAPDGELFRPRASWRP